MALPSFWISPNAEQYKEAVKESEQRWLTTLASIGDAVIATDNEGRITFMDPVAEKCSRWPARRGEIAACGRGCFIS